jgi:predicted tellurium resistance membrane protein TerC
MGGPMFEIFSTPEGWVSVISLSAMEIVLGIDNIIFISILSAKLPVEKRSQARRVGLIAALFMRLGLLFTISWMMRLTNPLFSVLGKGFSGRDLILLLGGAFLVGKATYEIHEKLEGDPEHAEAQKPTNAFASVIVQIMLLDIVFSLDSVITAVGMAPALSVMVIAMLVAVGVMVIFADPISDFVEDHPTMKILALSFLILIGVMLVAESMGQHVSKAYIYFAMGFSVMVELINLKLRNSHSAPIHLHGPAEQLEAMKAKALEAGEPPA